MSVASKCDLTAAQVRNLLHYNPNTGIFTWRQSYHRAVKGAVAGSLSVQGYWQLRLKGRACGAHRVAWLYMTGEWPVDQIDHINRNRSDNRWVNLRQATNRQNQANRIARKDNSLGFKGVLKRKSGRFAARIRTPRGEKWLGTFATLLEASRVYEDAMLQLHGEFGRIR